MRNSSASAVTKAFRKVKKLMTEALVMQQQKFSKVSEHATHQDLR